MKRTFDAQILPEMLIQILNDRNLWKARAVFLAQGSSDDYWSRIDADIERQKAKKEKNQ